MGQNRFRAAADRLGLMAYLFVMNGGRPDWSILRSGPGPDLSARPERRGQEERVSEHQDAPQGTVPAEDAREREKIAA